MDLATETATVWPVSEAKVAPNWRKDLGEALAKHLTSCGFNSNLQGWHFSIYNFVCFISSSILCDFCECDSTRGCVLVCVSYTTGTSI